MKKKIVTSLILTLSIASTTSFSVLAASQIYYGTTTQGLGTSGVFYVSGTSGRTAAYANHIVDRIAAGLDDNNGQSTYDYNTNNTKSPTLFISSYDCSFNAQWSVTDHSFGNWWASGHNDQNNGFS